jgi:hypothetical protein
MFGEASDRLSSACAEAGLPLDRFAWTRAAERAGFAHGAFHLVRPDGYLSLVAQGAEAPAALAAYQARHGLRF